MWGNNDDTPNEEKSLLILVEKISKLIRPYEQGSLSQDRVEKEDMVWRECENLAKSRIVSGNVLELPKAISVHHQGLGQVWHKLAMSNGLSDSVKLAVLEGLLDDHVERIKRIPVILEQGRRIPIGRAATLRLIGELLHFRAALNLDSEFLDTPEIYWSQPDLEELYKCMTRSLDTRQRISVLNKKMDYAENIAELLRTHLSESHMFRLEWAIVLLVGFEVINNMLWWFV